MQKSADAFRTISEVADDLSLPQHVLRFWETRFPQIRPLKRAGGRRYYRPADIVLLRTIRQLLYDDGYTIKGVQRLLKEQGPKGLGHHVGGTVPIPGGAEPEDAGLAEFEHIDGIDDRPGEPAFDDGTSYPDVRYRALVEDALTTVDECRQILEAVLRPAR